MDLVRVHMDGKEVHMSLKAREMALYEVHMDAVAIHMSLFEVHEDGNPIYMDGSGFDLLPIPSAWRTVTSCPRW
jgi:hypothetical protein